MSKFGLEVSLKYMSHENTPIAPIMLFYSL